MSDTSHLKCPRCGKELPPSAPEGLCPACLGALNFATETNVTGADAKEALPPMTPAELAPHFPQLEILECLGRGGMGVVYKAKQKSLNRLVALKLLAPERVQDAKFAARFEKEAQALALLNHPNIVTVHDFGQAGGFYFLLMEFVDGMNLRQLLHSRKLQPTEALAIVPPVCEALQFAHEHGIVHRDIKPENLLLAKDGRVKIADFGIAKILGDPRGDHSVSLGEKETPGDSATQQTTMGTPQYMAPEQREQPQIADHRADIYSLGVVLYELLTGELPASQLQPPSRKVQIDVRLDEVVLRALEKTPELRYQTAGEFKTQVETIRTPAEPSASKPGLVVRCRSCQHERTAESVFGIQWSASHREPRMFIWCPRCHCPRIGEVVSGTVSSQPTEAPGKPGGLGVMLAMLVTVFYTLVLGIVVMAGLRLGVLETLIVMAVLGAVAWSFCPRTWVVRFRALSWLAFVASLPAFIFSAFFIIQRFRETGGWHPNPAEAVMVPLIGLGAILLPWAQSRLRRASREAASATSTDGQKGGARLLWVVGALLIALILVGAVVFITNANRVKNAQVVAREAAERKQQESQRWATTTHQLAGPPYIAQLPYGGTVELLAV